MATFALRAGPARAQFQDETAAAGLVWNQLTWGAAFADFDADLDLDLYAGHHYYDPILYWNNGAGEFDEELYPQPWGGQSDRHGILCISLDVNSRIDMFITHGADGGEGSENNELYLNASPGIFNVLTGAGGMADPLGRKRAASAADYNGDRRVDVWVGKAPDAASPNSLYRNNGGTSFTDVAAAVGLDEGLGTVGGIWGDIDDDGDPDLLVGGEEFTRPTVLWRNDGGTFANANAIFSPSLPVVSGADWGDFDNDDDLDLAVVEGEIGIFDTFSEGDSLTYFFNTRYADTGLDGMTVPSSADTAYASFRILAFPAVTTVFLGPDGVHPSVAVGFPLTDEYVGAPTFTPGVDRGTFVWRQSPGGPWEVRCSTPDIGFDNFDGWITDGAPISGVVGHDLEDPGFTPGGPRVWRNDGAAFHEVTGNLGLSVMLNPRDVSWVDYDNDSDLDLHVVDMGTSASPNAPDRLWRNDGAAFTDVTTAETISGGTQGMGDGGIWGDVDGDLDLDLFLREGAGPANFSAFAQASLLVNKGERGPAMIMHILGRQSGPSAMGVKVTVFAGPLRVQRQVQANSWRGLQDPMWLHVGLAGHASTDSVVVQWLTGVTQVHRGLPAGTWVLEEGVQITGAPEALGSALDGWRFEGIAPQPARENQQIRLAASRAMSLTITVHDLAGRTVRTLHEGPIPAGSTALAWDGRDERGLSVAAGVFWIRATDGQSTQSAKSVRIR